MSTTFYTVQELKNNSHMGFMKAYINWNHATLLSLKVFTDTCTDKYTIDGIPEYLHNDLQIANSKVVPAYLWNDLHNANSLK